VHAAELEKPSEGGLEEEESERRSEEENERRVNEEEETEFTKEVCTETTSDNMPHHQSAVFDWATDIDESIGPVPSLSDFYPTTPPQPIRTPPTPTDYTLTAYMPTVSVTVSPNPDRILTTPRDVAPSPDGVALISTAPTKPAPIDPTPFYPNLNQSTAHLLTPAQTHLSVCPILCPLHSRNPIQLYPQQLSRQSHVNLAIFLPFAQALKIPGAVFTTAVINPTWYAFSTETQAQIHLDIRIHAICNQTHIHIMLSISNSISMQNCKYQRKGTTCQYISSHSTSYRDFRDQTKNYKKYTRLSDTICGNSRTHLCVTMCLWGHFTRSRTGSRLEINGF
jgi:hypothetical protein